MRSLSRLSVLALFTASTAIAAPQTFTGKISDSNCGAHHKTASEHGSKMSEADCTRACVKGGARYVFVHDGKVLQITNQDFADLEKEAGKSVKLTGELAGDAITVSKIVAR